MAFQIDVVALKWGIGIVVFFLIAWIILAKKLLKSEPKAIKVNLADRYEDLSNDELEKFSIKSDSFKSMVYDNFSQIMIAFMEYDYAVLKKYLTKDLYDYYVEQLELLKSKKWKNIYKIYDFLKIKIYQVTYEHDMMMVNVYLNVRMLDYMIEIDSGKCIKGDKDKEIDFEFQLSFVKKENDVFLLCRKDCINDMIVLDKEKKDK